MAKRKRAKGFGGTENKYETIFEKVSAATNGEKKSISWYKGKVKSLASTYETEPDRVLRQEKRDNNDNVQDENILRKTVKDGHLYFFEYKAKTKSLPYYDKFPLVYVIKDFPNEFYGANLHYLRPKARVKVIQKLERGLIDMPRSIIHKYIKTNCKSLFLDLTISEWQTSIFLPVEDFIITNGSGKVPYDRELVWEETDSKDRLKAQRIIKGYGKQSDKEMVT
jgi:hypothetical protein